MPADQKPATDTTQPPGDSDAQLVERAVAGDQRAFELLVIKYRRRIERLIGRMVRDVNLVEDIAQETFIRAYRALHQFRGDAQFYTFFMALCSPMTKTMKLFNAEVNQAQTRHPNRCWRPRRLVRR